MSYKGYSPYYLKTTYGKKWKKIKDDSNSIEFKHGKEVLVIDKVTNRVFVGIEGTEFPEVDEEFSSYPKALSFAKKYMKENP